MDRASGKDAETPADVIEELDKEENTDSIDLAAEGGHSEYASSMQSKSLNEEASSHRKRKRKSDDDSLITGIKEAANIIGGEIAKTSELFTKAIGVDAVNVEKMERVQGELRKIQTLTIREHVKAAASICCNHELTDLFFANDDEEKKELVMAILAGEI